MIATMPPGLPVGIPEVVDVHYDLWILTVRLQFGDGAVYVRFDSPRGFRVLDEGDLSAMFANDDARAEWLTVVESRGWGALEASRPDFQALSDGETEYLIAGINDCVSVIASDEPELRFISVDA